MATNTKVGPWLLQETDKDDKTIDRLSTVGMKKRRCANGDYGYQYAEHESSHADPRNIALSSFISRHKY